MEEMSLDGNLVREIVMEKICMQSKKDETGRRKSFRVTQNDIQKELQSNTILYNNYFG